MRSSLSPIVIRSPSSSIHFRTIWEESARHQLDVTWEKKNKFSVFYCQENFDRSFVIAEGPEDEVIG